MLWFFACIFVWEKWGTILSKKIGLDISQPVELGIKHFISDSYIWFTIFYATSAILFGSLWALINKNKWSRWSIFGSALIIYTTYFTVQFSVAYNNWLGPFYDLIQKALSGGNEKIEATQLYGLVFDIIGLFVFGVVIFVINRFFISHFVFRWRTAMNNHYTSYWQRIRHIEGASQRIQEDTMKLARIMEELGVSLVNAIMTLIAFLPLLHNLSKHVTEVPILGQIPYPLVTISLAWSLLGTGVLALVGIKLPGLEFNNQKVEAAYRKELVYGEDDALRAKNNDLMSLYKDVRKNYFRLYFHYMYFNIFKRTYMYIDWIIILVIMTPTIAAGAITFGVFTQIYMCFNHVGNSFQYIANSWNQIVDLMSIHKRLKQLEVAITQTTHTPPPSHPSFIDMETLEVTEEGREHFVSIKDGVKKESQ